MTAGIIIIFAGYTVASYGICLLRDYNIPWKQWINPLDPWQWGNMSDHKIPRSQVFPSA
jgi:hypothetical protein